jgi:hypothetical protein
MVLGVTLIYLSRSAEWLSYLLRGDRRRPDTVPGADRRAR